MQTRSKTRSLGPGRLPVGINRDHCVWSELPADLQELVLSFLPVVNLCRFRVVCKRWNNLFCSPEFGKLCAVNAARNVNGRACLVVHQQLVKMEELLCTGTCTVMSRWSILDLREKKWYDLKPRLPWCSHLSDMDGGFVCTYMSSVFNRARFKRKSLKIFNLFGGATKLLPDPPFLHGEAPEWHFVNLMTLKLIVDTNSNTFKVLLTIMDSNYDGRFPFCIYESSANQWTIAQMPPFVTKPEGGSLSKVVFQGLLYCCSKSFIDSGRGESRMLWTFNFLDGSWEDAGVVFPSAGFNCRELAVIDNRLFVTNFQEEGSNLLVQISEILLAEKTTRMVVQTKLSNVLISEKSYQIRAFGFNNSKLVLCTRAGQHVMYDLVAGEWELLPPIIQDDSHYLREAIAGRMDYFRLPNPPR